MDYNIQEYLGLTDDIEYNYLIHRANKHIMSYPVFYPKFDCEDVKLVDFDQEVK